MKHLLRTAARHVRGNVVAYLALFVALGGTSAYAAAAITGADVVDESLTSADLKDGQVKAPEIASAAVGSAEIAPLAVTNARLGAGSVTNGKLGDGSVDARKMATAPAASTLKLSPEATHSAQGTILHADYEFFDTAGLHDGAGADLVAPVAGTYVVS